MNFIDNISWDTASLEDEFEEELLDDKKDQRSNSFDSDGNPKDFYSKKEKKSSNRDSEQAKFEKNDYNFLMHANRNCYAKELASHENHVISKRF